MLINPVWEKSFQGLTSNQYFSPGLDCGRFEKHTYDWQEERFYLSEYRQKDNCDGVRTAPEKYPMVWNGEGD